MNKDGQQPIIQPDDTDDDNAQVVSARVPRDVPLQSVPYSAPSLPKPSAVGQVDVTLAKEPSHLGKWLLILLVGLVGAAAAFAGGFILGSNKAKLASEAADPSSQNTEELQDKADTDNQNVTQLAGPLCQIKLDSTTVGDEQPIDIRVIFDSSLAASEQGLYKLFLNGNLVEERASGTFPLDLSSPGEYIIQMAKTSGEAQNQPLCQYGPIIIREVAT